MKEAENHQSKIENNEKRLEEVNAKLKEEEEAGGGDKKVTAFPSRKMTKKEPKREEKMLLHPRPSNRKK